MQIFGFLFRPTFFLFLEVFDQFVDVSFLYDWVGVQKQEEKSYCNKGCDRAIKVPLDIVHVG